MNSIGRPARWMTVLAGLVATFTVTAAMDPPTAEYQGRGGGSPKEPAATTGTVTVDAGGVAARAGTLGTSGPEAVGAGAESTFRVDAAVSEPPTKGDSRQALPSAAGPHADYKASAPGAAEALKSLDTSRALPAVVAPAGEVQPMGGP